MSGERKKVEIAGITVEWDVDEGLNLWDGVPSLAVATPDVAVTSKTKPFAAAFKAKFGSPPAYTGYTAYDEVYFITEAIKRAGSTDPDKMVAELEKTDYVGIPGHRGRSH